VVVQATLKAAPYSAGIEGKIVILPATLSKKRWTPGLAANDFDGTCWLLVADEVRPLRARAQHVSCVAGASTRKMPLARLDK
jgi:hypothetical protein